MKKKMAEALAHVIFKIRPASILNGLRNDSSHKMTDEKGLDMGEVYAEKIKFKVFVNQQNSISQYKDID